jgi:predicted metalloprotease
MHRFRFVPGLVLALLLLAGGLPALVVAQDKDPSGSLPGRGDTTTTRGDETVYTSPTYGYRVGFDDSWQVADESSAGGYDSLALEGEASSMWVEGIVAFEGDPATCIDGLVASLAEVAGVDDLEEVTRRDRATVARASYTLTFTGESGVAQVGVVYECRPIVEGVSVVVFTLFDFTGELQDEVDRFDAVVDSYEPGEPTATTGGNGGSIASGGGDLETRMTAAAGQVDAFWSAVFASVDVDAYEPPTYVFYDTQVETKCGTLVAGEVGPAYCPTDRTVYVDLLISAALEEIGGPFAPAVIIAHEVGHHVQALLGIEGASITTSVNSYTSTEIELMADCMAGAWTGSLRDSGQLNPAELEQTVAMIVTVLGDPISYDALSDQAHGPGSLRTWWFLKGMYEGPVACFS